MNNSVPAKSVRNMFNRIAGVYDFLNHLLSLGIDKQWRSRLVNMALPQNGGHILDLATGTMDVAIALSSQSSDNIFALDFSMDMLKKGKGKLKKRGLEKTIHTCCGDILSLPFPDNSMQSVTMAFGIRNIHNRKKAFSEIYRVLTGGGKVCILEFGSGKEKIWGGVYNWYLAKILPQIGQLMGKDKPAYDYLAKTIQQFPPPQILEAELKEAGFKNTGWQKMTSGIVFLHWGYKTSSILSK